MANSLMLGKRREFYQSQEPAPGQVPAAGSVGTTLPRLRPEGATVAAAARQCGAILHVDAGAVTAVARMPLLLEWHGSRVVPNDPVSQVLRACFVPQISPAAARPRRR